MAYELQILACAVVWGLIQIALAATFSVQQRGFDWAMGPRDQTAPLTGMAARVNRSLANFSETFPLFAAAVLAIAFSQRGNATSAMGAQLYLWARVLYLPVYALGISYVRTLVWAASLVGILMVLKPLF
jgi:uncharacterized MAPEG superfamily protein